MNIRRAIALSRLAAAALTLAALMLTTLPLSARAEDSPEREAMERRLGLPSEREQDPPAAPAKAAPGASVASTFTFGRFTAIQVNVNALGQNILNDAANEPSIAVDPNNHNRMVIGWRQFDNVVSNFRQAGFGYTTNGGTTWTAGKIQPGVFHSDPVLEIDSSGDFFYNGLNNGFTTTVFQSTTGGASWNGGVFAQGGDKQWMVIDRGLDHFYQAWSSAASSTGPNTFNRSVDDGASFITASSIPHAPLWGTMDTALDHTLYLVGWGDQTGGSLYVARSLDAQDPESSPPLFTAVPIDLGGFPTLGGPNPEGLLGQLWIAVDKSNGPRQDWVYVLGSVETPTDPVDVHFIRSTNHGINWSAPKRVNDDLANDAYQWLGTMSVAPNGRIDVVWVDSRQSPSDFNIGALYYSYSLDGGDTWSANEQMTQPWNSTLGWPNQQKIGDYYDMVSDNDGADLAFSATLNNSQDVYYMRIPFVPPVAVGPGPGATLSLDSAPNPFAEATTIRFDAPSQGARVRLDVFDVTGHRVATLLDRFVIGAGQTASWDGRLESGAAAPAGIYFARLTSANETQTRKLMRVR
jgi:hypothetical protein